MLRDRGRIAEAVGQDLDEMIFDRRGLEGRLDVTCPELEASVTFSSCFDGS